MIIKKSLVNCTIFWYFLCFHRSESDGFECRRMPTARQTSSNRWRVRVGVWSVPKRSYVLRKTIRTQHHIFIIYCNINNTLHKNSARPMMYVNAHSFFCLLSFYCCFFLYSREILRLLIFRVTLKKTLTTIDSSQQFKCHIRIFT